MNVKNGHLRSALTPDLEESAEFRSTLVSRNITVAGRRTSVRLEPEMWEGLREICRRERANIHQICSSVSLQKPENTSLTAAIRVFCMRYFRSAATEEGHQRAGHGFGLTLALDIGSSMAQSQVPPLNKKSFS